ncbi:hypothetical protein ACFQZC_37860 [Streptacidiphilus monticola]
MNSTQVRPGVEVLVRLRGGISAEVAQYARDKLAPVVEQLHGPVPQVQVKLTQDPHPRWCARSVPKRRWTSAAARCARR